MVPMRACTRHLLLLLGSHARSEDLPRLRSSACCSSGCWLDAAAVGAVAEVRQDRPLKRQPCQRFKASLQLLPLSVKH